MVGYSLSSEQRYVGGKLFSRNISNMTFFFVDMKIFERCLKVEFRFHTPRETF